MLSFFKTDHTAHFANKVLCSWRKGKAYYSDWDTFEEDFIKHFCLKDQQLSAITKLKGTSWYQGRDSVEDYINRFQEPIDILEYSNNKTIVVKFQKGLDPGIQNKVALLGNLAPDFNDPRGWYKVSIRVAQNKEANDTFLEANKGAHTLVFPLANSVRTTITPAQLFILLNSLEAFHKPEKMTSAMPPKDGPSLMDVDKA